MFHPLYILIASPAILFTLWSHFRLKAVYSTYQNKSLQIPLSGGEASRNILDKAGLTDVPVMVVKGKLIDHYDPVNKRVVLSDETAYGESITAVGIAAHETGHAIQHAQNYAPLQLRLRVISLTNFGNLVFYLFIFLGIVVPTARPLIALGILLFFAAVFCQLITLPVEYDASRRALQLLQENKMINDQEIPLVQQVLRVAALTYVAALLTRISQLMYQVILRRIK